MTATTRSSYSTEPNCHPQPRPRRDERTAKSDDHGSTGTRERTAPRALPRCLSLTAASERRPAGPGDRSLCRSSGIGRVAARRDGRLLLAPSDHARGPAIWPPLPMQAAPAGPRSHAARPRRTRAAFPTSRATRVAACMCPVAWRGAMRGDSHHGVVAGRSSRRVESTSGGW